MLWRLGGQSGSESGAVAEGPGQGLLWAVPFVLARHSQPLRAPLWSACGCGSRRSHSRQPMDRSILRRSLSSFPSSQSATSPDTHWVAECDRRANNHNPSSVSLTFQQIRANQSTQALLSCLYRTIVFFSAGRAAPERLHTRFLNFAECSI